VRMSIVEESSVEKRSDNNQDDMVIIETNLDDISPEFLGNAFQNELMELGVKDFYFTSVQMKKGRPGLKLSVLFEVGDIDRVSDFIFENTSTIGLRYFPVSRKTLARKKLTISTKYGDVDIKEVETPSGLKRHKIELDSLQRINKEHKIGIPRLYAELHEILIKQLSR